ncbi:MAG: DUF1501 domain-containing protein [Bacteroidetes bacterium]|nr:DUF1501 domain-containing protein [Bacteroidota bacterium]
MDRRFFLKNAAAVSVLSGLALDGVLYSSIGTGQVASPSGRALVLVQLEGGNDGINTVIPLDQYAQLSTARKNILLPERRVLPLHDAPHTGLHPALSHLAQRYEQGEATIVQGVGCPQPDLSHFKAIDIWHTGSDATSTTTTGWLGRYLDVRTGGAQGHTADPPAVQIGPTLYKVLQGRSVSHGTIVRDTTTFYHLQPPLGTVHGTGPQAFYSSALAESQAYLQRVERAARAGHNLSDRYPAPGVNTLSDQLRIVARLISGGLRTMVYIVNIKGFDTHDRQVDFTDTTQGAHADLLGQVSVAIDAFMDDLSLSGRQQDVLTMMYSEFGRRIMSNASYGCDHGTSGPVMLFGSALQRRLIGHNPRIPDSVTVQDNLAMQTDFRSLYASVLRGWFGASRTDTDMALMSSYDDLDLFRS